MNDAKSNSDIANTKEKQKINNEISRYRTFDNQIIGNLWKVVLALIPLIGILFILGVHRFLGLSIYTEQYVGLFIGLILFAVFLGVPAGKFAVRSKVPWYDWILALLGLSVGFYLMVFYPSLILNFSYITPTRLIVAVIAITVILEAIRRMIGFGMLIIVLVFISYGIFAPYLPGVFEGRSTGIPQLLNYLYIDPNSLLDLLYIAATIGICFMLFGQVLLTFGGGDIINKLAISSLGRFRGGPAKASVVGSSLSGTITGGAVTNVLLTGPITIPLMKKNGYSSVEAGAVESVSSTGGSIMPPVMGIAAFIIAETLGVPYTEIAIAAIVPALLYYICVFFQVDLMAAKKGLRGMAKDDLPSFIKTIMTGWLIFPAIGVLIYFLFFKGYSPQLAAIYGSFFALIILSFHNGQWKRIFTLIKSIFVDAGRIMLEITIVLAAAGFVVGVTGITGLGFNIAKLLAEFGSYGLLPLLIVCAVASIILGMGMPSVAAYSLVAVLVAPAIVELGVVPLAAHLFVFYFAIISNFTPPIALACFTAAPIAQASPHKIGFQAMKLGIVAYLVPFLFVYAPELLLSTDGSFHWGEALFSAVTAVIGCYFLAVVIYGYMFRPVNTIMRIFNVMLAGSLFLPVTIWEYSWLLNIIAIILAALYIIYDWRMANKSRSTSVSHTVA